MGKDENAKSFLWSLFHASRAAKERAAEQEWEMELYQGQGMGREGKIRRVFAGAGLQRVLIAKGRCLYFLSCVMEGRQDGKTRGLRGGAFCVMEAISFPESGLSGFPEGN